VFAVLLGLLGIVWTGQGAGLIRGSFMTGSGFWAAMGLLCLAAAGLLGWLGLGGRGS